MERQRLAASRGLFRAHRALNEAIEQEEAQLSGTAKVDNCLQLARALPPGRLEQLMDGCMDGCERVSGCKAWCARLMDVFQKLSEDQEELRRLAGPVPPMPHELTADADEPLSQLSRLKSLCATGPLLLESTAQLLRRLERSGAASGGPVYAELRLPLHGETDAWGDLARWSHAARSVEAIEAI